MFIVTEVKDKSCKCGENCGCKKETPQEIVENANTVDGRNDRRKKD